MSEVAFIAACPGCGGDLKEWLPQGERCRCEVSRAEALATLDSHDPEGRATIDRVEGTVLYEIASPAVEVRGSQGVLLIGNAGIGKTFAMLALMRAAVGAGRMCRWENAPAFVRRVQDTYSRDHAGPSATDLIAGVAKAEIVFLDDVGKEKGSEDARAIMYSLLDELYAKRRTVIASTNEEPEALEAHYADPAIISRLKGLCRWHRVRGTDKREAAATW